MFKNLDQTPNESDFNLHYHADFIELLALTENENGISVDVVGSLYQKPQIVDDCFILLDARVENYGEKYPFILDRHNRLSLKEELTDVHKLYIFLLLCATTEKLENTQHITSLRTDFEAFCYCAMSQYLPAHASCFLFGKSPNLQTQRYQGHIADKFTQLASDLKTMVLFDNTMFASNDTGDGGIDIVAWLPFTGDSELEHITFYAAQCATGRNWLEKQDEPIRIKNFIRTPKATLVCLFIPFDGRNVDGSFNHKKNIVVPVLFDRLRLLNLFSQFDFMNNLQAMDDVVEPALAYEVDII